MLTALQAGRQVKSLTTLQAREAGEVSNDEMTEDDAKKIILDHPLPKARQRTNIVSEDYVPEGRLFGAFTTRGEGITQATFRFPLAVKALMVLASTREGPCADEGFLSAQVNCGISLPVHKDKNNHGETWLIGLGDYTGGRLWIESPCGQHPPPVIARKWQESLRGDLVDVRNKWYRFDPRCYHAVEPVESGRTSFCCSIFSAVLEENTSTCTLRTAGSGLSSSSSCWRHVT